MLTCFVLFCKLLYLASPTTALMKSDRSLQLPFPSVDIAARFTMWTIIARVWVKGTEYFCNTGYVCNVSYIKRLSVNIHSPEFFHQQNDHEVSLLPCKYSVTQPALFNSTFFCNFSTPCFSVSVLNGLNFRHMDDFQKGSFVTVGISDRLPPHTEASVVFNPCQNKTRETSFTNYDWHTKYVLFTLFFEYLIH